MLYVTEYVVIETTNIPLSSTDRELKRTNAVLLKCTKRHFNLLIELLSDEMELEIEYGYSSLKNIYLIDCINVIELLISQMWYSGQNGQTVSLF